MYCTWPDIHFDRSTVTVRHKPEFGWTPKAYKEREVPIPAKLVNALRKAKKNAGDADWFSRRLAVQTETRLSGLPEGGGNESRFRNLEDFYLHKFRATFATWSLWAGVDLRTVQQWLGHSDMESTMRYLKPSRSQHVRDKVNEIFA